MTLKISAKTEYACVAMVELASQQSSADPVRIRSIAERHAIPSRFLVQILLQLKNAGLVDSVRGASGGYRLKIDPTEITLAQVMSIIDHSENAKKRARPHSDSGSEIANILSRTWIDAEKCRQDYLESVTLADLVKQSKEPVA